MIGMCPDCGSSMSEPEKGGLFRSDGAYSYEDRTCSGCDLQTRIMRPYPPNDPGKGTDD